MSEEELPVDNILDGIDSIMASQLPQPKVMQVNTLNTLSRSTSSAMTNRAVDFSILEEFAWVFLLS